MEDTEPTISPQPKRSQSRRKPIILLIAMTLLFGGLVGALYYYQSKDETTTSSILTSEAMVDIDPSGFLPQTINVKSGTNVTWQNKDTASHLVVSGPYPANNQLPDLNSEEELQNSESYSFVFEQPGTYYYHDGTGSTNFNGVVIVE